METSVERIAELVAELGSGSAVRRAAAARALADRHPWVPASDVVGPLRRTLGDPITIVRVHAAEALALVGAATAEAIAVLVAALHEGRLLERRTAVAALGYIGAPAAAAAGDVAELLRDSDEGLRLAAAQALRTLRADVAVVPALLRALSDEDREIRDAAAATLAGIGEAAVPVLIQALHDPASADQAFQVLDSIGRVPRASAPALLAALRHISPRPERLIVRLFETDRRVAALGWLDDGGEALEAALAEEDVSLRGFALREIVAREPDTRAIPALLSGLADPHDRVRSEAVSGLALVATTTPATRSPATEALVRALEDSSSEVRRAAVAGLARIAATPAVPALRRLLDDRDADVRMGAATAVWRLSHDANTVLPVLLETLEAGDATDAAVALARDMGGSARAALAVLLDRLRGGDAGSAATLVSAAARIDPAHPVLRVLIHHVDPMVREAVVDALGTADPAPPDVVALLREASHDEAVRVRATAARMLWHTTHDGKMVTAALVPELTTALYECRERQIFGGELPIPELRAVWPWFVELLVEVGASDPSIPSRVAAALTANDATAAVNAARIHWELERRPELVVPALLPVLDAAEWPGVIGAMELIARMGDAAGGAVLRLIGLLGHRYWLYRWYAAQALGCVGRSAEPALARLVEALDDREDSVGSYVRRAAALAVASLAPEVDGAAAALVLAVDSDAARVRLASMLRGADHEALVGVLAALARRFGCTGKS